MDGLFGEKFNTIKTFYALAKRISLNTLKMGCFLRALNAVEEEENTARTQLHTHKLCIFHRNVYSGDKINPRCVFNTISIYTVA